MIIRCCILRYFYTYFETSNRCYTHNFDMTMYVNSQYTYVLPTLSKLFCKVVFYKAKFVKLLDFLPILTVKY